MFSVIVFSAILYNNTYHDMTVSRIVIFYAYVMSSVTLYVPHCTHSIIFTVLYCIVLYCIVLYALYCTVRTACTVCATEHYAYSVLQANNEKYWMLSPNRPALGLGNHPFRRILSAFLFIDFPIFLFFTVRTKCRVKQGCRHLVKR